MTIGAIGEALTALSEDAEISASDIEILRRNLTLVVFPEQGGDRFSRLSPFMEQSSSLAVEADLEEIGPRSDQVMNLEVNEWKVEPTVVEKTDDGNMHEVVNDDKYDEICKSLESDFRSRDEVARQKALLDEKQSSMNVMLPLMQAWLNDSKLPEQAPNKKFDEASWKQVEGMIASLGLSDDKLSQALKGCKENGAMCAWLLSMYMPFTAIQRIDNRYVGQPALHKHLFGQVVQLTQVVVDVLLKCCTENFVTAQNLSDDERSVMMSRLFALHYQTKMAANVVNDLKPHSVDYQPNARDLDLKVGRDAEELTKWQAFAGRVHAVVMEMVRQTVEAMAIHPSDDVTQALLAGVTTTVDRTASVKEQPPPQQQIVHVHVRVTKDEVVSNEVNLTSDINMVYGEGVVSDAVDGGTESIRSLKEKVLLAKQVVHHADPGCSKPEGTVCDCDNCSKSEEPVNKTRSMKLVEKDKKRRKASKAKRKQKGKGAQDIITNDHHEKKGSVGSVHYERDTKLSGFVSKFVYAVTGDHGFGGLLMIFFMIEGFVRRHWYFWLPVALLITVVCLPSKSIHWLPKFNDARSQILASEANELCQELDLHRVLELDQIIGEEDGPAPSSIENLLRGQCVAQPGSGGDKFNTQSGEYKSGKHHQQLIPLYTSA